MKPPRPFVLVNMALSADGKIASARRGVNHFSSPHDEHHLYTLRGTVDALLNGARTVDTTPVKMDAGPRRYRQLRLRRGLTEHPLRVIASGSGSVDLTAEVFRHPVSPILILTTTRCAPSRFRAFQKSGAEVYTSPSSEINFLEALQYLHRLHKVRRLLCEGGGALNDALFSADLIDEIHLTLCPRIIGGRDAPTLSDGHGIARLADSRRFQLAKRRRIGDELYLTYRRRQ